MALLLAIGAIPAAVKVFRHGWPIVAFQPAFYVWLLVTVFLCVTSAAVKCSWARRHAELLPRRIEIGQESTIVRFKGHSPIQLENTQLTFETGTACDDTWGWLEPATPAIVLRYHGSAFLPRVGDSPLFAIPATAHSLESLRCGLTDFGISPRRVMISEVIAIVLAPTAAMLLVFAAW